MKIDRILISRIDAIGDVTLTLPMCGYLKSLFPSSEIYFLGRGYTQAVIEACSAIDHFIDYSKLSDLPAVKQSAHFKSLSLDACIHVLPNKRLSFILKNAGIPFRLGTTNRWFHWLTCNKLVKLSRRKSNLHEAELNLRLLSPLGVKDFPALESLHNYYHFDRITGLPEDINRLLSADKFNLILHPKSHGSGKEWPLAAYKNLIELLPAEKYRVFISGSEKEKPLLAGWIKTLNPEVVDLTGRMNLAELIAFLHKSDGLIASGTGPLHLAAASGIHALGLFPSTKPIHPGRWAPLGRRATYIESGGENLDRITADQVALKMQAWFKSE